MVYLDHFYSFLIMSSISSHVSVDIFDKKNISAAVSISVEGNAIAGKLRPVSLHISSLNA